MGSSTPKNAFSRRAVVALIALAAAPLAYPHAAMDAATQAKDDSIVIELSGAIFDAATGLMITCGTVVLIPADGAKPVFAVTGLNGRYFFEPLPPGAYDIRVIAPGYDEGAASAISVPADTPAARNFPLAPRGPGGFVTGRISLEGNGRVFPGARAELWYQGQFAADTFACSEGYYELSLAALPASIGPLPVEIVFSSAGARDMSAVVTVDPAEGAVLDQQLPIFTGTVVPSALVGEVRAHSAAGAVPIPGARITVRGIVNFTATADDEGLYGIPTLFPGRYTVSASAPRHGTQSVSRTLVESLTSEASFALTPFPPTDVNGDGVVNAVDVQLVINAALGIAAAHAWGADVNADGVINALDVQLVINAALDISR